ncbi:EF-P beta-lysylation protein EpmB [Gilvimarinus sp. SDUM040013]|uniref:L-lysine 2,3-aminomutase n=1 Tax=Gilvimarinus gilvus TaxID=3058038 RepID=A0ABU4RTQ1_9GAMM|nr:EF-P beta-lysylation protein EpmB [Gilvimarinus sp. SDUM040013]MDO3386806.1 EF-P beta-lysylation protein EpmB [Gilvimarinus sp. SDUM040013]MDX6848264.1 EF-P beta-lysylation protein EpmB [Gilvimarinus sp. SDUM040013]
MIHRTALTWHTESWQEALKNLIRSPKELFELLQLDNTDLEMALEACGQFELRVPRSFAARMQIGDPNDPLLKQVLPTGRELLAEPGYSQDPLGEQAANPHPGLIHKYKGRVLLVVTGSCAINCRYCFRRHFPYQDNRPSRETWRQALDYIAQDDSINEVIFSGGDPLNAPDSTLQWLSAQIAQIPHITRLRVHSRLPIVIPARITDSCLEWMASDRFDNVLVIHANHANEIDAGVASALARLKSHGVTLLNQTVLLNGVNNHAQTLINLSERLFQCGVVPYYLHMLDKVAGAAHFDVDQADARRLVQVMRENLPGYLVPKLVREIAGEASKTPIL